jgi:cysteinyl-tRNA synthetase
LWEAYENLGSLQSQASALQPNAANAETDNRCRELIADFDISMSDDFNTDRVLANMFELVPLINSFKGGQIPLNSISRPTFELLQKQFTTYLLDVFGLKDDKTADTGRLDSVLQLLIQIRKEARSRKDFATSDKIRNELQQQGILLKDEKDGNVSWNII